MEKELSDIIFSLNKGQIRRFRGMFEMEGRKQAYFKLFNILQKRQGKEIGDIEGEFGSSKELSKAKADLFNKLVEFLTLSNSDGKIAIERLKWSWEFFLEKGFFELAARSMRLASRIIQKDRIFDSITDLLEAENALPSNFLPATSKKFQTLSDIEQKTEKRLCALEKRFSEWRKMMQVPPPSIPALKSFHVELFRSYQEYSSISPEFQNPNKKARFFLMLKTCSYLSSEFDIAEHYQLKHLSEITKMQIPSYKQELLLINEYKNYCAILQEKGEFIRFWEELTRFSSVRFKTPNGKSLARINHLKLRLSFYSDFGLVEYYSAILPEALEAQKTRGILKPSEAITFGFIFAKFQFISGDYRKAQKTLATLFRNNVGTPAYQLYFPYVLVIQILSSLMINEQELANSLELSLQRFLRKEGIKFQFFEVFFDLRKALDQKSEIFGIETSNQLQVHLIKAEKLAKDKHERFPFAFFNLVRFIQAKIENIPFSDALKQEMTISPDYIFEKASGEK